MTAEPRGRPWRHPPRGGGRRRGGLCRRAVRPAAPAPGRRRRRGWVWTCPAAGRCPARGGGGYCCGGCCGGCGGGAAGHGPPQLAWDTRENIKTQGLSPVFVSFGVVPI